MRRRRNHDVNARLRVLGRRVVMAVPLGSVIMIYSGPHFWRIDVLRNGTVRATAAPIGWRMEHGRRAVARSEQRRSASETWLVVDVPRQSRVDITARDERRRRAI